jgi:uncharacterized DUF497 family protein
MTERSVEFEWDPEKAASNLRKHRVSFDEAETVFDDVHAYIQEDELYSEVELREWLIGYSNRNRLLLVSFVQRAPDRIRLVSARVATRRVEDTRQGERRIYEERASF